MELESTLKPYFAENNTPDVSLSTLWGAHKEVLRGRWTVLTSAMKKDAKTTKLQTEKELMVLELWGTTFSIVFPTPKNDLPTYDS